MLLLQSVMQEFIEWTKVNHIDLYNEAGLQFELLYFLRTKLGVEYKILAERNIGAIRPTGVVDKKRFTKREMDIYIRHEIANEEYCIEMKFLTGGAIPSRMSQVYEDVKFLEVLKTELKFKECLFFLMTAQKAFYSGTNTSGLYSIFRAAKPILRTVPTKELQGFLKERHQNFVLSKEYETSWQVYGDENNHRFFWISV